MYKLRPVQLVNDNIYRNTHIKLNKQTKWVWSRAGESCSRDHQHTSYELIALFQVGRYTCLEQHRVESKLRVEQREVPKHFGKEVDANVTFVEVLFAR